MSESGVQRYIALQYGRKDAAELSEETGVPVGDIARLAEEYYDSLAMSANARFAKSLLQLEDLVNEGLDRAKNASDRDSSAHITAAKNALQAISKLIADREKADRENSQERDAVYGRMLYRIVERAVDRSIGALTERFPDIDKEAVEQEFQKNLMLVAAEADAE